MQLPKNVMYALTAEVVVAVAEFGQAGDSAVTSKPMTDDEAEEMGRFWYRVAAGEIRQI